MRALSHLAGLVRRLGQGSSADRAEYHALYLDAYGFVQQRARLILRDDESAHDAAQEAFTRAWIHWRTVSQARSRMGWLMVTVTRICIDRQRSRELELRLARRQVDAEAPTGTTQDGHLAHLVWLRLRHEDPVCQQVVVHTWLDGMTHDETADHLNLSRRTVQRYLEAFRARHATELATLAELPRGV